MNDTEMSTELERVYTASLASGMRSIAVAACNSGEGVSTLVQSLARRNLQSGRSTLVLDLNLNRPTLDQAYNVERLAARQHLLPGPARVSLPTEAGDVELGLVCAPIERQNIVPLREPGMLEAEIARLLEHYDNVIVATTAINLRTGALLPGERVAAACDGTLLSVMSGQTGAPCLERCVERLSEAGARLLGLVMNDRDNPPLKNEIIREVKRLERFAPRVARWLSERVSASRLLALEV